MQSMLVFAVVGHLFNIKIVSLSHNTNVFSKTSNQAFYMKSWHFGNLISLYIDIF